MLQSKEQGGWMDKKTGSIYILSIRNLLQIERHRQTESKGMEKDISCKWKWKNKAGLAILIPDIIDFKAKTITRDKEGPSNFTSGYLSKETQNTNLKNTCFSIFFAALFTIAKVWKQPKCPLIEKLT